MLDALFFVFPMFCLCAAAYVAGRYPGLPFVAADMAAAEPFPAATAKPPQDDPPVLHVVPRDAAEFVIPDFRPGVDRCRVVLNDADAEFDVVVEDGSVRFLFLDGESMLGVAFPGLSVPPFDDTEVVAPDGDACRLSALVAAAGADAQDSVRLARVQPPVAEFAGFRARHELIEVWVSPTRAALPDVVVRPTGDGRDAEVLIDGRPAARLRGAPDAGPENVRVLQGGAPPLKSRSQPPAQRTSLRA